MAGTLDGTAVATEMEVATMGVQLNHTIVKCRDKHRSAAFVTELLGLPEPVPFGPFLVVETANGVSLDYQSIDDDITAQHYAFLVGDDEFDEIFGRIADQGLDYWADPGLSRPGQINHEDGGRGCYFADPDGHLLEILTVPYGGWPDGGPEDRAG